VSQPAHDLRVKRSQRLLRDALIDLIEERGFDTLTVGEITERAMVSRATFYRNYQDKYDLVEQIYAEATQVLFDALAEPTTEHPPRIWTRFFEHIAEYERLYRALLGRKGSPWFVQKMRGSLAELIKQYTQLPFLAPMARFKSPLTGEYLRDVIATVFVETITWWLEQGRPYSPQEMASRCAGLASAIFREAGAW
jgi:AcrR family transcriptional regulator